MPLRRAAGALALALLLVACGSPASDETEGPTLKSDERLRVSSRERIDVEVRATGPIRLGKNTVVVSFPARADAELASASALMPAHGHGSPAPAVERDASGFVVRDLVLYMSGRWELRLGLRVDAYQDEAIIAVDVP